MLLAYIGATLAINTLIICNLENAPETHRAFLETSFASARKQGISKRDVFEKVKNEIHAQV